MSEKNTSREALAGAAVRPQPHSDLIQRLRSRAMIEAPAETEGYEPTADADDEVDITWGELAEIAALLREAADALESPAAVSLAEGRDPQEGRPVHECHSCKYAAYVGLPCLNCGAPDVLASPPAQAPKP